MDNCERITCSIDSLKCKSQAEYSCELCSAIVKTKANLKAHMIKTHKIIETIYDEAFYRKKKSVKHRIFHCPIDDCKYNISSGNGVNKFSILKQHFMWVHAPRAHNCTKCKKSFGTAPALKYHMKSCGKRYFCDVCNTDFSKEKSLDYHRVRFHSDKKIEACLPQSPATTAQTESVKVLQPIYIPLILPMGLASSSGSTETEGILNGSMDMLRKLQAVMKPPVTKDSATQVEFMDGYQQPQQQQVYPTGTLMYQCNGPPQFYPNPTTASLSSQHASMQTVPFSHHLYHVETQTCMYPPMEQPQHQSGYFIDAECMTSGGSGADMVEWQQQLADNHTQTAAMPVDLLGVVDLMDIETQTNFQDIEDLLGYDEDS